MANGGACTTNSYRLTWCDMMRPGTANPRDLGFVWVPPTACESIDSGTRECTYVNACPRQCIGKEPWSALRRARAGTWNPSLTCHNSLVCTNYIPLFLKGMFGLQTFGKDFSPKWSKVKIIHVGFVKICENFGSQKYVWIERFSILIPHHRIHRN